MTSKDLQTHKVLKKPKEKKPVKSLDKIVLTEIAEHEEGRVSGSDSRLPDKKPQGIVINGKTYTCATCKAGHRVGVCKHARERPMKATHPPGRPSAGAPKKVNMYMLVYIPAPDEDETADDEKGIWKIDKEVTTDLKGNILTPAQVRERRERKDALRSLAPEELRSRSTSIATSRNEVLDTTNPKKPGAEVKSCCKHKENVTSRNTASQSSITPEIFSSSPADGCNCGRSCTCAFCPQHPNNSTSMNVAREQAMHFASHPGTSDQSIVAFQPTLPQSMSCMGGQPQFAMSRQAGIPSFEQLHNAFPDPGYVIGYPVWPINNDSPNLNERQFSLDDQPSFAESSHLATSPSRFDAPPTDFGSVYSSTVSAHSDLDYFEPNFGIGNAFVASAGARLWGRSSVPTDAWIFNALPDSVSFNRIGHNVDYMPLQNGVQDHQLTMTPHQFVDLTPPILDELGQSEMMPVQTNATPPQRQENNCPPSNTVDGSVLLQKPPLHTAAPLMPPYPYHPTDSPGHFEQVRHFGGCV